jgi:hypothetical protein
MRLAEREPTMEEIVVALRETRRGAGRVSPFTVVGRQPGGKGSGALSQGAAADAQIGTSSSTDITDLRDGEIERLLAENACLNERVMFLLKVIEREQTCVTGPTTGHAELATDHGAIVRNVRAALEAELRPVLLVMLRLLEKQRTEPAGKGVRRAVRDMAPPAAPEAASCDADGIIDLDARRF